MDHDHEVYIALTCQRTAGDYSTAQSIDNTISTWLANNYPAGSKSSSFEADTGVYRCNMQIPAASPSVVQSIWTSYNNNVDNFDPHAQPPHFRWNAIGDLSS